MKRLNIDFAQSESLWQRPRSHVLLVCIALSLAGVLLCGLSWQQAEQFKQEETRLQNQLATINRSIRSESIYLDATENVNQDDAVAINHAVQRLNQPWPRFFAALESCQLPQVALLELEQDGSQQVLRGTALAANTQDLLAYLDRLKQHPYFGRVILLRQEKAPEKMAGHVFVFEAETQPWVPERKTGPEADER